MKARSKFARLFSASGSLLVRDKAGRSFHLPQERAALAPRSDGEKQQGDLVRGARRRGNLHGTRKNGALKLMVEQIVRESRGDRDQKKA